MGWCFFILIKKCICKIEYWIVYILIGELIIVILLGLLLIEGIFIDCVCKEKVDLFMEEKGKVFYWWFLILF